MIIFLDGAYGVGKTAVALKVKDVLAGSGIVLLESDYYFQEMMREILNNAKKNNSFPAIGGCFPQNNLRFLEIFKRKIEESSNDKNVIVDMALTQKECKEKLLDYFLTKRENVVHIILTAETEIIIERIKNDSTDRDKQAALDYLRDNVSFLEKNYNDAKWIKTDNMDTDDIANEVIDIILGSK